MSYFLNTGYLVSEEFKNQSNFTYFLNQEIIFSKKSVDNDLFKMLFPTVKDNIKKDGTFVFVKNKDEPFNTNQLSEVKRKFKKNRPPDIITDLNTNASPFSPKEEFFFGLNEMCDSLLETNETNEIIEVKKPPSHSPKTPPKNNSIIIIKNRTIYRKTQKN